MKRNIVVAMTGASGVVYSIRLLDVLCAAGCDVHLIISPAAQAVLKQELDLAIDLENFNPAMLMLETGSRPKDRKLQALRHQAGISSDESNAATRESWLARAVSSIEPEVSARMCIKRSGLSPEGAANARASPRACQ